MCLPFIPLICASTAEKIGGPAKGGGVQIWAVVGAPSATGEQKPDTEASRPLPYNPCGLCIYIYILYIYIYIGGSTKTPLWLFSPNSVSTLRGSYGKRKGLGARLRCPLCPRAFCLVFTADSCSCLMSKCVSTAQARTK